MSVYVYCCCFCFYFVKTILCSCCCFNEIAVDVNADGVLSFTITNDDMQTLNCILQSKLFDTRNITLFLVFLALSG